MPMYSNANKHANKIVGITHLNSPLDPFLTKNHFACEIISNEEKDFASQNLFKSSPPQLSFYKLANKFQEQTK